MGQETARAALPAAAHVALREAFAAEVAERLPRIVALRDGQAPDETVRRDVHTLASSAWVVGEPLISRLARDVEDDLLGGPVAALVAALQAVGIEPKS